jgi:hypothetical protein
MKVEYGQNNQNWSSEAFVLHKKVGPKSYVPFLLGSFFFEKL